MCLNRDEKGSVELNQKVDMIARKYLYSIFLTCLQRCKTVSLLAIDESNILDAFSSVY